MSETNFDSNDLTVAEKIGRLEGKLDHIITRLGDFFSQINAIWKKIDVMEARLIQIETKYGVWSKVWTAAIAVVSSIIASLITASISGLFKS